MHLSSIFLREPSKALYNQLVFLRRMGGGPRTFPGGLNKWQWKRMHEKKAREKEKRLLDQEKQVYQARIRSEIRAKLASTDNLVPRSVNTDRNQPNYGPVTPQDHVKALADRFMKEGAEDLWNENDGPSGFPENKPGKSQIIGEPIDLQTLVMEKSAFDHSQTNDDSQFHRNVSTNVAKRRHFSTYCGKGSNLMGGLQNEYLRSIRHGFDLAGCQRRGILMGVSNMFNLDCYYSTSIMGKQRPNVARNGQSSVINSGREAKVMSDNGKRAKWPRFRGGNLDSSDDDFSDDDDDDGDKSNSSRKIFSSSAALGKHDVKIKKRVPLNFLEDEDDLSQQVEAIRKEISQRKSVHEDGMERDEAVSVLSTKRFDECGVSSLTVQALSEAGYVQMTKVQEATLSAYLEGQDALVKARAGTGKSIAFLIPAIETVLKASSSQCKPQRVPPIYVLILCPTRELASQICAEANVLLKHHDGIGVQTLTGGTRFKVDQRRLESEPSQGPVVKCDDIDKLKWRNILVATPGRLLDHVESKSGISVRLMGLQMLILDEADRLLDLGFRKDMEKIVDCLPRKRHSLLCSATIPKEVRRISQLVLKREHAYIDTVGLGSLETNEKVGIPMDRGQYIHRLGRTGRQGKEGEGLLLLAPWEQYFLDDIKDLPLEKFTSPEIDPNAKAKIEESLEKIDTSVKEAAYHAWLGYYNSISAIGRDKTTLAELAKQFSASIGLQKQPALYRKTALKMGLKGLMKFHVFTSISNAKEPTVGSASMWDSPIWSCPIGCWLLSISLTFIAY
ncbi:dead box ATP-dependent RNA helicase [Striga asiatica]|uniref:ATP-dependent RNA helicase n=1 Tax=Striga asiatica TaxID=4170 RepID=A0A5A7PD64_STRAF|nr:dead box ATP-dependent RNA helicase [Striga asiatica]